MNKNDLRWVKTEKNIKTAFLELVDEKGFEEASISDICERAMISRNTFYAHYCDKYALLNRLFEIIREDFQTNFIFFSDTKRLTRWYIENIDKNRRLVLILLKCPTVHFQDIIYDSVIRIPTLEKVPDFDFDSLDIKTRLNIVYMLDAMISFTKYWLEHYDEISKEEACGELAALCSRPVELYHKKIFTK